MDALPAIDGFYLPADWLPAKHVWMAWPARPEIWGDDYEQVCMAFAALARQVADVQATTMIAPAEFAAAALLQLARQVEVQAQEVNDGLIGDYGPVFLTDGDAGTAALLCRFNCWGNRYHDWQGNAECARWIADEAGVPAYACPLTLEGGSFSGDGAGTLLVTADILLNPNRNPTLDRRQIEERLALYFGARKVIWLEGLAHPGIASGQVIEVARFVGPGRVACAMGQTGAAGDLLGRNLDRLWNARDALGRPLEVVEVPCAEAAGPGRAPGSYLGFGLLNDIVLLPAYGGEADAAAAEIIARVLPGHGMVPVAMDLYTRAGGTLHGLLLKQPDLAA